MKKKYVILGGGTAGWMTAAALVRFISPDHGQITLIESESIGTVGVGEATIPHIRVFNEMLGIDEDTFMQAVNATYKLGIRFSGWGDVSSDYYHPFGDHGFPIDGVGFHHYWVGAKISGVDVEPFHQFSIANVLASGKKFTYPSADPDDELSAFSYAYHIDASAYAKLLRSYAEDRGVIRVEGQVDLVNKDNVTGFVTSLLLTSGQRIEGDFFIDCSGFRSLLLGQALEVEFESWKKWLPCDTALAVPTDEASSQPYTRSIAKKAGWCWQIPLKHRTGNGHVFSSDFISPDEALDDLSKILQGQPLKDPMLIKFEAGVRKKTWEKNCVAIGLACGFLEPLESTSIYLIEVAILRLLELLPIHKEDYSIEASEFNRQMDDEYLKIRDFIILHYALNRRDEAFWKHCATMTLPSSLQEKIDIFKATSHVVEYDSGLFLPPSWLAVYLGQGLVPERIDSRLTMQRINENIQVLDKIPQYLRQLVDRIDAEIQFKKSPPAPRMSLYGIRR